MFVVLVRRGLIQFRIQFLSNKSKFKKIYSNRRFFHDAVDDVSAVSLVEIKRVLKASNVSFLEGHTCLLADCPLCENKSKNYINKTTGIQYCFFLHYTFN